MNFDGHDLYKLNKYWVFDLTTFTGYFMIFKRNKLINAERAFRIDDSSRTKDFVYMYYVPKVPVGVLTFPP